MHFAEAHAAQPFNEDSHALECPQLGAELVGHGALEQRGTQRIELLAIQLRRPARDHRAQCAEAALIESSLPGVRGLPRHTNQLGGLCRSCPPASTALRAPDCGGLRPSCPCTASPIKYLIGERTTALPIVMD
jgi:hypothetical protein